ncbi:hypothetical protein Y032_0656g1217 [Ancylostoma ceylanicum]|uniref:Mos1 transposase HTH domain-containing protein n=1 Tax=Ancylostoma ceylanicum TaxID=53326 RepID=A0A016WJI7_9BILA|nr:hypothetical protein Y032_0656g1217 [Ancylostoma ceylanicum]
MAFSKQYICGLLVYGFKSGESTTASSRRFNVVFGDLTVVERTGLDWPRRSLFFSISTSIFPNGRDAYPETTIVDCGSW